jgi:acyl-CoA thioesterase I
MRRFARPARPPARLGRRRALIALVAAFALSALAPSAAAAFWLPADFGPNDPRRLVTFGDSITDGFLGDGSNRVSDRPYAAVLETLLSPRQPGVVVVNAGQGGEATDGGVARMPFVLAGELPGFVLIMEGTNDATFQAARGRFDPGEIAANLRTMVQLVKANGSIPILGAIPPNFRPSGVQFADGARAIIAAVNAMLPGVADQEGIRFVDVFGALNDPALFGPPDGLHPNQAGYDALGAAWQPAVDAGLDESLVLLARIYLLRVDTEHLRSGQVLQVDLTLADRVTGGLVDVYVGLLLPAGADAALGCEPGGSIAFATEGFAELVPGCLSDAIDTAVPLYRGLLFREPIPLVTAVDFWSLPFTAGYPPGTYTLFFAITHAGDPTRLSVWTTHAVDFVP